MAKSAMDCVKLARDAKRPHLKDFIDLICSDFEELHGDRLVNDDRGLVGGFATIRAGEKASDKDVKVLVLGHNKGTTVEENMASNFGMANPDGYRKAMRLAKLAEKFHLPVVTFVDTPGAYPGKEAEERGQAEAIAKSLEFFSRLRTPVVVVVTGCAGILWRDGAKAPEAAEALKITAPDLLKLGAIDEVVKEPAGGAQKNHKAAANAVRKAVLAALRDLAKVPVDELVERRYEKIRSYGNFH